MLPNKKTFNYFIFIGILSILCPLLVTCGIFESNDEKKYNITEYFPLYPGNTWYHSDGVITIVTDQIKTINGVNTNVVKYISEIAGERAEYIKLDSKGIRVYGANDVYNNPPLSMGSTSMKKGEDIKQSINYTDSTGATLLSFEILQTLIMTDDYVECGAGKFGDCLKIMNVVINKKMDINDTSFVWLASGIGTVKSMTIGETTSTTLDSALIGGRKYPVN